MKNWQLFTFLGLFALLLALSYKAQPYPDMIMRADAEGYYMYLPAIFKYKGFENVPIKTESQFKKIDGKVYSKFTCGIAILQAPFYLVNQLFSPCDGYSRKAGRTVQTAAVFYGTLGLWLMFRFLLQFFPVLPSLIAVFAMLLGSNMYYYLTFGTGMSHIYSFFLFSVFVWATHLFYKNPSRQKAIGLGLLLGLITLIRPTNLVLSLFFIFYDIYSIQQLKERLLFFKTHFSTMLLIPIFMLPVFIPQLMYWQYMFRKPFVYSYTGEGFIHWKNPYFFSVLFSHTDGWLLYSPMLILALLAAFILAFKKQYNGGLILAIILLMTYIFGSWWAWWFGASFGHRCYIEFYALLIIPFAWLIHKMLISNNLIKITFFSLLLLSIYYSLKMTYLASGFSSSWDGPNWGWDDYWSLLGRLF